MLLKCNEINTYSAMNLTFILAKIQQFYAQLRFKIRLFLKVAMNCRIFFLCTRFATGTQTVIQPESYTGVGTIFLFIKDVFMNEDMAGHLKGWVSENNFSVTRKRKRDLPHRVLKAAIE